jgi:hypothetical protein
MNFYFESLVVTNALSLHEYLMDTHHNTSFMFILEEKSISLAFRAHIYFCSGKEAGLWLITKFIPHHTLYFVWKLHFHVDLI